jgi:hypothetical protein
MRKRPLNASLNVLDKGNDMIMADFIGMGCISRTDD